VVTVTSLKVNDLVLTFTYISPVWRLGLIAVWVSDLNAATEQAWR